VTAAELDSQKLIDRLYPEEPRKAARRRRLRRLALRLQRHLWKIGFVAALVLLWVVLHVYYYNRLVDLDTRVKVSWAQVEAQLQRRHNIQANITLLVVDYAKHERGLHERLTRMRTNAAPARPAGKPPAGAGQTPAAPAAPPLEKLPPRQLDALFPQIRLVAEQYPQLRLSENFQQFSRAIIDTENKVAAQIMTYNEAVNRMSAMLRQVPGNIFGPACGFRLAHYRYYQPQRETLPFRTVETRSR
jgi:LemA protein